LELQENHENPNLQQAHGLAQTAMQKLENRLMEGKHIKSQIM
jgi:hypothetical protein